MQMISTLKLAAFFALLALGTVGFPQVGQAEQKRQHDPVTVHAATTDPAMTRQDRIQQLLGALNKAKDPEPARNEIQEPDAILGTPLATKEQCVRYLLKANPVPAIQVSANELVSYYYEEGMREGVRPDVAFAQALKETGYFRYGGTVTSDQNNYCGLGTTSSQIKGAYFSSPLLGVRAHIQHLLAYASTRPPVAAVVDPRYELVRSVYSGSTIDTWEGLNGRWAVPGRSYGEEILQIHQSILGE